MKTKEEIEQLAEKSAEDVKKDHADYRFREVYKEFYIDGYTQCQEDMFKDQTVTRFEVIDENGRAYTQRDCKIELSYQDDGRTLKVFINPLNKQD